MTRGTRMAVVLFTLGWATGRLRRFLAVGAVGSSPDSSADDRYCGGVH